MKRLILLYIFICILFCSACSSVETPAVSGDDTGEDTTVSEPNSNSEIEEIVTNAEMATEQAEEVLPQQNAEQSVSEDVIAQTEEADTFPEYVKVTGDNVNIRSEGNLNGIILGKAKKDSVFEKKQDVDDWTRIIFNESDGYIKSEYLMDITEEEYNDLLKPLTEEIKDDNGNSESNSEESDVSEKIVAQSDATATSVPSIVNKSIIVNSSTCVSPPFHYDQQHVEWIPANVGDTINYTVTITNDWGVSCSACLSWDNSTLDRSFAELFGYLSNIQPGESRTFSGTFVIKNVDDKTDSDLFISIENQFGVLGRYWVKVN